MSQRPYKYSRKACRIYRKQEEQAALRRPTVYGSADPARLAVERSRARLTNPNDSLLSKDFAAYFQSSHNYPTYALTSHTSSITKPKKGSVIPAYPMVQSLRWNPYVETSSVDDYPSEGEDTPLKCTCENCTRTRCAAKISAGEYKGSYKSTIMTFTDQSTMTPRLADAGCGCGAVPRTRESEVSVTSSEIAVKDAHATIKLDRGYPRKMPAPILKNCKPRHTSECYNVNDYDNNSDECDEHECKYREAEKEYRDDRLDRVSSSLSHKYCSKKRDGNRIMLYNEGINDEVANQCPVVPLSPPKPSNVRKDCSRVSMKSARAVRYCVEDGTPIPYCHKSDSRYHQFCKASENKYRYIDEDPRQCLKASPRAVRLSSKLPKRVLTSDQDIDEYVECNYYPRLGMPISARNKNKC